MALIWVGSAGRRGLGRLDPLVAGDSGVRLNKVKCRVLFLSHKPLWSTPG